jgi:hypothetical protein
VTSKTTLLHLLGGLGRSTGGQVRLAGQRVDRIGERDLARLRQDAFGFVFQAFHLMDELSAVENVELPALLAARSPRAARRRACWNRSGLPTTPVSCPPRCPAVSASGSPLPASSAAGWPAAAESSSGSDGCAPAAAPPRTGRGASDLTARRDRRGHLPAAIGIDGWVGSRVEKRGWAKIPFSWEDLHFLASRP